MIIKTDKNELLKGLQQIGGVITTKNTLPILSNILLQTKENLLELVATDLNMGIITNIKPQIVEEGGITIPAKRFIDIIKELPGAPITITTKKSHTVNIECENTFFKIASIPIEEFPKLPKQIDKNKIVLPRDTLKDLLTMTLFAVSHDETRYVLGGILFVLKDGQVKLVATDGRRLSIAKKDAQLPKDMDMKAVVPAKTLQEINRIITDEGEVAIYFDENQAMFVLDNTTIISRLIEGEFPNYEQAIPKQSKDRLTIDRDKFLLAIKRASLLTTPDSQAIRLDITKDKLVVSKHTPNIGEAREELECKYAGEEFFIGFNPSYLLDGLKNIKQEQLNIEFQGAEKPAAVRDEDDYLYIVLPMQIG